MAYTNFDATKPNAATQNGTAFAQSTRDNLSAIRDMVIAGVPFWWNISFAGGTAEQREQIFYNNGTQWIRGNITYGTTGGATDNVTTIVYAYSSNNQATYDGITTMNVTYDTNGNVTAVTWS